MASDRKDKQSNSIPIRFFDDDEERSASATQPQSSDFQETLTDEIEISEVDNAAKPKVDDSRLGGPELIGKQLNEVLESFGVQPIPAVGERFDPHIHEAVVTEPSDEHEPDTVIAELARGYRIGDRLLRPAMVKVSARRDNE